MDGQHQMGLCGGSRRGHLLGRLQHRARAHCLSRIAPPGRPTPRCPETRRSSSSARLHRRYGVFFSSRQQEPTKPVTAEQEPLSKARVAHPCVAHPCVARCPPAARCPGPAGRRPYVCRSGTGVRLCQAARPLRLALASPQYWPNSGWQHEIPGQQVQKMRPSSSARPWPRRASTPGRPPSPPPDRASCDRVSISPSIASTNVVLPTAAAPLMGDSRHGCGWRGPFPRRSRR